LRSPPRWFPIGASITSLPSLPLLSFLRRCAPPSKRPSFEPIPPRRKAEEHTMRSRSMAARTFPVRWAAPTCPFLAPKLASRCRLCPSAGTSIIPHAGLARRVGTPCSSTGCLLAEVPNLVPAFPAHLMSRGRRYAHFFSSLPLRSVTARRPARGNTPASSPGQRSHAAACCSQRQAPRDARGDARGPDAPVWPSPIGRSPGCAG